MNAQWDDSLDLAKWWTAIEPKLAPNAIVIMFSAGKFTFKLQASNPRRYRYELIWKKDKGVGFLNAAFRPLISHELILIFSRQITRSTFRAQRTSSGKPATGKNIRRDKRRSTLYRVHARGYTWIDDGKRHPTSILEFKSVARCDRIHPTQKPLDLMRWLVRTYTRPGDLIVDPFIGGGTTPAAAMIEGRRFWGCERDTRFFRAAKTRLNQLKIAA